MAEMAEMAEPYPARLLMRSEKGSTGFKGVRLHMGRYQAKCDTAPCHNHYFGRVDTPEEAAQAYLRHWVKDHPEKLASKKRKTPPS
jgi:hypothetical protein